MSDLSPRDVIDRIARGLELTRQEFTQPKAAAEARRPPQPMVKRKKARPPSARSVRAIGRPVRRSRSPVPNRGRQAMIAVAADKSSTPKNGLAADKAIERLLLSLKEDREALALREHAESVSQSRRAIYFVTTFVVGAIAGALLMKYVWPMIQT